MTPVALANGSRKYFRRNQRTLAGFKNQSDGIGLPRLADHDPSAPEWSCNDF